MSSTNKELLNIYFPFSESNGESSPEEAPSAETEVPHRLPNPLDEDDAVPQVSIIIIYLCSNFDFVRFLRV